MKYIVCAYKKSDYPGSEVPYCSVQDGATICDEKDVESVGERLVAGRAGYDWYARVY